MEVVGWHEDTTRKGTYVLTIRTPKGGTMKAVESRLSSERVKELQETVSKTEART